MLLIYIFHFSTDKYLKLIKGDLFSQNERQVARELKEIWLIKHL